MSFYFMSHINIILSIHRSFLLALQCKINFYAGNWLKQRGQIKLVTMRGRGGRKRSITEKRGRDVSMKVLTVTVRNKKGGGVRRRREGVGRERE